MKRKTLTCFLSFMMIFTLILPIHAEEEPDGACGTHASYTLNNHILVISGQGAVDKAPWEDKEITHVLVKPGITELKGTLFKDEDSLTTVTLPDGLKSMETGVFDSCDALKTVMIHGNAPKITETEGVSDPFSKVTFYVPLLSFGYIISGTWRSYHVHRGMPDFEYTVNFDVNGGEGTVDPITLNYNKSSEVTANLKKPDCLFAGWGYEPEGKVVYDEGSKISQVTNVEGGNVTLYAIYKDKPQTEVTGLETNPYVSATEENYTQEVKIENLGERSATLEFCTHDNKWEKVEDLIPDESGKVTLNFPQKMWAVRPITTWRVKVPESSEYASCHQEINIHTDIINRSYLHVKSAVVMKLDEAAVLYNFHMNSRRAPASMTKIMTAILALENLKMDDVVTVSSKAANTSWTWVPMHAGDKVKVKDLLYATLLASSNGAATALGEKVGGSVKDFCKMMNEKAKELGCKNTFFSDANGLSDNKHYSTAYDMALMLKYAYSKPIFKKVVGTRSYKYNSVAKNRKKVIHNTSRLLREKAPGNLGGKTGYTDKAGNCYAGIYKYDNELYITVVMGGDYSDMYWEDTKALQSEIRLWKTNAYRIVYNMDSGQNAAANPKSFRAMKEKKVKLANPGKYGAFFKGWYSDKALTKEVKTITKGDDYSGTILYAKWKSFTVDPVKKVKLSSYNGKLHVSFDKVKTKVSGYTITYYCAKTYSTKTKHVKTNSATIDLDERERGPVTVKVAAYRIDSTGGRFYGGSSKPKNIHVK